MHPTIVGIARAALVPILCLAGVVAPSAVSAATTTLASDPMTRTVASGWGSAPVGGAWSVGPDASSMSVDGAAARIVNPAGATRTALLGVGTSDATVQGSFQVSALPTVSNGHYLSLRARQVGTSAYAARVIVGMGGVATLEVRRVVGTALTTLGADVKLPFTLAQGDWVSAVLDVKGSNPVSVSAKAWKRGTTQPSSYLVVGSDSTTDRLTAAGSVGVVTYVSSKQSGSTTIAVDDFSATTGVANQPPVASFTSAAAGLAVTLDAAASSDPDGSIAGYSWAFGDGSSGSGPRATHTYAAAGSYQVGLTVTDNAGATAVQFRTMTVSAPQSSARGARLPVSHSLGSLTGTVRYVSPTGSDSATGTASAPLRTLARAEALSNSGDSIVLRGGTYPITSNETRIQTPNLTVVAYPGEVPVFDGSIAAPGSVTAEGALRFFSYQPMPAGIGEGLSLTNLPPATFSGSSPTGLAAARGWACVTGSTSYVAPAVTSSDADGCTGSASPRVIAAYFPDQVWVGGRALTQVTDKSRVSSGTFFVQRSSGTDAAPPVSRLYLSATDAADMSQVRVSSSKGDFVQVVAANVRIEGLRIRYHSPAWNYRTMVVGNAGDGLVVRDVEFDSNAAIAVKLAGGEAAGGGQLVKKVTLDHVSLLRSGWSAGVILLTDDVTVRGSIVRGSNAAAEFAQAPQSGAFKMTKADRTSFIDTDFEGNVGHGLWWDQSCFQAVVANSRFVGNTGPAVFFEISHGLTLVNNRIVTDSPDAAVKAAGASGLRLVNNTIVGGRDVVELTTDTRSKKYDSNGDGTPDRLCAEHTARYRLGGSYTSVCGGSTSDLDYARYGAYGTTNQTPGLTFLPGIDMLVNNVLANPSGPGRCGPVVPLCVAGYTTAGGGVQAVMNTVFGKGSVVNGNVYQTTSGYLAKAHVNSGQSGGFLATDLAGLRGTSGLGSSYYGLSVEANGRAGTGWVATNGTATSALDAVHSQAAAVPTDATLNAYIPAGTRHYGALG